MHGNGLHNGSALWVLFVQAASVVLIKPKSWERYGLKTGIEAAKKRLHHTTCWRLRWPTSPRASPGVYWLAAEALRRTGFRLRNVIPVVHRGLERTRRDGGSVF
jgi:hypothetical protein